MVIKTVFFFQLNCSKEKENIKEISQLLREEEDKIESLQ
jgi:hypothetical protein